MIKKTSLVLLAALTGTAILPAETLVYKIDPVHSGISFKIRHFINKVPGTFSTFTGEIHRNPESPEDNKATATIEVGSVDTRNDDRDSHLQNEDFFQANLYPTITFTSTKWIPTGDNTYSVEGLLKMLDVEKPITIDVTYLGEMEGNELVRAGWEGETSIDRTDWGISYGTPAVGSTVDIELNIQAHRKIEESTE